MLKKVQKSQKHSAEQQMTESSAFTPTDYMCFGILLQNFPNKKSSVYSNFGYPPHGLSFHPSLQATSARFPLPHSAAPKCSL